MTFSKTVATICAIVTHAVDLGWIWLNFLHFLSCHRGCETSNKLKNIISYEVTAISPVVFSHGECINSSKVDEEEAITQEGTITQEICPISDSNLGFFFTNDVMHFVNQPVLVLSLPEWAVVLSCCFQASFLFLRSLWSFQPRSSCCLSNSNITHSQYF